MLNNTFTSFANPHWFIGVVENNMDLRHEGRVQVRAFGVHGTLEEVPTADLPWAPVLINGGFDFAVIPLNSFVLGIFMDGKDAQQPLILGAIANQYLEPINPAKNGWGVVPSDHLRLARGTRPEDFGQPSVPRIARGEGLEETYILGQETNRVRNVPIAGGGSPKLHSADNLGVTARDDGAASSIVASPQGTLAEKGAWIRQGLIARGMPAHLAEGVVLNMADESGLDFSINEHKPLVAGSRGGFGLIQWTGPRRVALEQYAAARGESVPSADTQLDFLMHELQTSESANWAKVANATSASEAASLFMHHIERPHASNRPSRDANYAQGRSKNNAVTLASIGGAAPARMGDQVVMHPGSEAPIATTFHEPATAYNAQYPYNRVIESGSGHTIEIDDTPGAERVMVAHRSGAYMQMAATTTTYKSPNDTYDINDRNHNVYIGGASVVTIAGDAHILVQGNRVEEVMGDSKLIVHGNHELSVAGRLNMNGGDEASIRGARVSMESNVENTNIKVGKVLRFESTETLHFKSKNVFLEATEALSITAGTDFLMTAGGDFVAGAAKIQLTSSGEAHIKGKEVKVGGGSKVHLNANVVVIDDVVRMAEGASAAPEASEKTTTPAESATPVKVRAPATKSVVA